MKKIILMALLALLGVTQMAAQEHEYIPFVREGVKWVYYTRDTYARPHNHALELKGDVEINGKMRRTRWSMASCPTARPTMTALWAMTATRK